VQHVNILYCILFRTIKFLTRKAGEVNAYQLWMQAFKIARTC
jgi:hypothetical protein